MPTLIDLERRTVTAAGAAMNAHDAKAYSQAFSPDATVTEYGLGQVSGRVAIADGIQRVFDAFPDFKFGVSKVFVSGDVVVQEWVMTGTNEGEFNGAKPTHRAIGIRGAEVLTFTADGHIKRAQRYFDTGTVVSQLGLAPPGRPVAALPSGEPEWHVAGGTRAESELVEVAKAFNGAFESSSAGDVLRTLDDNLRWSDLSAPVDLVSTTSTRQWFAMLTTALTGGRRTYGALFAVDDAVVSESMFTATHAGQLGTLKPTHGTVTLHTLDFFRVKNGKVLSGTSYSNSFDLLGQEGLLPRPPSKP